MDIVAIVKEALRIARANKSLWLFGFLVGLGGGVNVGSGGGDGQGPVPPAAPPELATVLAVGAVVLVGFLGFVILKFVAAGALIEGVRRVRGSGSMTVREGFREGWAHWGVLLRIALLFAAAGAISVAVLGGPVVLFYRAFGVPAAFFAGALAVIVGVPWLVTLTIWHAFAERIAVFDNRRALDAIGKARLFLHGRVRIGLRLIVAGFLGVLFVGALGVIALLPAGALVAATAALSGALAAVLLGLVTILPIVIVGISVVGVVVSSVWTIGYLTAVER